MWKLEYKLNGITLVEMFKGLNALSEAIDRTEELIMENDNVEVDWPIEVVGPSWASTSCCEGEQR